MITTQNQLKLNIFGLPIFKWFLFGLLLVITLTITILMSKTWEKGENYISLQAKELAQSTGRNPCDILHEWLSNAKQSGNRKEVRDIQKAQKFLGCRNIQKRSEMRNLMSWYAAHAVMYVKYKEAEQDSYPMWENVLLIEAESDDEAHAKALDRAKEDEGDSRGTFTWQGKPATWCFAGIRKLVSCEDPDEAPQNGTEITYLAMQVDSEANLAKFVQGEPIQVMLG